MYRSLTAISILLETVGERVFERAPTISLDVAGKSTSHLILVYWLLLNLAFMTGLERIICFNASD